MSPCQLAGGPIAGLVLSFATWPAHPLTDGFAICGGISAHWLIFGLIGPSCALFVARQLMELMEKVWFAAVILYVYHSGVTNQPLDGSTARRELAAHLHARIRVYPQRSTLELFALNPTDSHSNRDRDLVTS